MNPGQNESDFYSSLRQAIAWTQRQLRETPDHSRLRSDELRDCHPGVAELYCQSAPAINSLVDTRSKLLSNIEGDLQPQHRLLCCDFAVSEASGLSELESHGYFNEYDLPPWDTWLAWLTDYKPTHENNGFILAYVPRSFTTLVQAGIDANPVGCISWIDTPDDFAIPRLKKVMPRWMSAYVRDNAK